MKICRTSTIKIIITNSHPVHSYSIWALAQDNAATSCRMSSSTLAWFGLSKSTRRMKYLLEKHVNVLENYFVSQFFDLARSKMAIRESTDNTIWDLRSLGEILTKFQTDTFGISCWFESSTDWMQHTCISIQTVSVYLWTVDYTHTLCEWTGAHGKLVNGIFEDSIMLENM